MAIITQKRILNLIPKTSAPVTIHVSQGNVGETIEFTLVKGDELFTATSNLTATVHGVRSDGANFGPYTCTLNESKVSFTLKSAMAAISGAAVAEIVLVNANDKRVGSSNFAILVEDSAFPVGVTYSNDTSVYESILTYVQGAVASMNTDLTDEIADRINGDAILNTRIDNIVAPSGEAPSVAEVTDARIGADGTIYSSLGKAIRTQIKNIGESIFYPSKNLYNPEASEVGLLNSSGTVVSSYTGYITTGYIPVTYPQNICVQSDSYRTNLSVLVCEYNNNHELVGTRYSPSAGSTQSYNVVFAIENSSAKYIRISVKTDLFDINSLMVSYGSDLKVYSEYGLYDEITEEFDEKIKSPIAVRVESDRIFVSTKYTNNTDLLVLFGKHGVNNLPDFWGLSTAANNSKYPKIYRPVFISDYTYILNIGTDWHSPFIVKALTNIDGDLPQSNDFTGGNHDYHNNPTAICDSLKFYIDGKKTTNYSGYCNNICIKWTNRVQATNTKKQDGSGRYVLKENHTLNFNGIKWESIVEIIPLENISILTYYGFQASGINSIYNNVRFIGANNRGVYNSESLGISGDNIANGIKLYGSEHQLELDLDTGYDMGNRRFYNGDEGTFNTENKAYFNLIDNLMLAKKGNAYFAKCIYCFSHV